MEDFELMTPFFQYFSKVFKNDKKLEFYSFV